MLDLLRLRLKLGNATLPFPGPVRLPEGFRGRPSLDPARCAAGCEACAAACPTGAIRPAPLRLDLGACLLCGACAEACAAGAIAMTSAPALAARRRDDLLLHDGAPPP